MARELDASELILDEATLANERFRIRKEAASEALAKRDRTLYDAYNSGWSVYSIAQALDLREPTVWTIIRKMNLKAVQDA